MDVPRRPRTWLAWAFLTPCFVACSLQNFDYLTEGPGTTDSGAATTDGGSTGPDVGGDGQASSGDGEASTVADTGSVESDSSTARGDADAASPDSSDGGGLGPLNYVTNPSFDGSTLAGWTVVPASVAQVDIFTQAPVGSATTPQGQPYELASYSATDSFTADISQTPANLPPGIYTFAGWFNRGPNNRAYIYAKGSGADAGVAGPDGGSTTTMDIPVTSSTGWEQVALTGILVTGGACQVGLYVDAAPTNWLNADGFTLYLQTPSNADAGEAPTD